MDQDQRRWWRLLEELPPRLGAVHRWTDVRLPTDPAWDQHAVPTLVACLDGVVRVHRQGGHQDLGPGEVLVLGAGVWHRHAPLRRGTVTWCQGFLPAWSDVWLGTAEARWYARCPSQPALRFVEAAVTATDVAARRQAIAGLLGAVLADATEDPGFGSEPVQRMVTALWRGLHQGITVEDLVTASGLQRAQAYAVFTAAYGITPKAALTEGRLSLAAGLLAAGLTVAETARRSGWRNADTFSRAWRRRFGVAPSGARTA